MTLTLSQWDAKQLQKIRIIFEKFFKYVIIFIKKSKNLRKKKFKCFYIFFFELPGKIVHNTLLRGRETTRKKYRIVFEKFLKYMFFVIKKSKKSQKKVVQIFLQKKNIIIFSSFFQKMSLTHC